jgi:pimeloyl-ACP methyl ester carboxylesterase
MHAEFAWVHGVRTRLLCGGDHGPRVLLIHGFGVTADMWVRIIADLERDHRVVAPDMLGHGFTEWAPDSRLHPEAYLSDHIGEVMAQLGGEDYVAVGSSLGGVVATHLLRLERSRVKGLVLIGTDAPFGPSHSLDPAVLRQAAANAAKALSRPSWANCEQRLRNITVAPDTALADVALVQMTAYAQPDRRTAYEALCAAMIESIELGSAAVRPEEIMVPTLVVCGRQDIRARIDLIRENYQRIPGAKLLEFDACGHLPHLEVPQPLAAALRGFIGDCAGEAEGLAGRRPGGLR